MRREVEVLDVARHPGVVELLGAGTGALTLRLVDGVPLSRLPDPSPSQMAHIAADVATTLADLHDIGVVHGAVSADHILIASSDRTVLCSFGRAAVHAPEPHQPRGSRAATPSPGGPAFRAGVQADVAALAGVLAAAAPAGSDVERIVRTAASAPGGPWPARRLATLLTTLPPEPRHRGRRLGTLQAPPPTHPPRPRRVAEAPKAPSRDGGLAVAPQPSAGSNARRSRVAVGLLGAVFAVLMTATAIAVVAPTLGSSSRPRAACPVADQGCQPPARPGGVIQTAAGRYRLGRPGDLVVVGRWHCGGPLPALLRPATGEVWVWDGWAPATRPLAARLVVRIPQARTLTVAPGSSGCDGLQVQRTEGRPVVIRSLAQP